MNVCNKKNYGHYWSRTLIEWGAPGPGQGGTLRGTRGNVVVDFREQIAIYVLYDGTRAPVYVGQTGSGDQRLLKRLRQHSMGQMRDRWTNFSWFGLLDANADGNLEDGEDGIPVSLTQALTGMEAILLQIIEPGLNKRGPNWGNLRVVEYLQYTERTQRTNEDIWQKLEEIRHMIEGE
ncbi:MAG: GIY-YIG nuclease family protein [Rhodobacteraceae bacterium]|nr:GIY-YIG nuclease family protein [Paracoccaceae bacterium]